MEPSITPITPPTITSCLDCDGPLSGNRWRCPACIEASEIAIREAGGRTVRPSDIARVREQR